MRGLNDALISQKEKPSFENSLHVANQIAGLFGIESDTEPKPFNDSRGKIKDHAGWFMEAVGFADRRACYKLADANNKNLDLKLYWVQKSSKRVISTTVALTPNFEDEPFYQKESVGIDFIIPKEADRIIVALSSNYTIRTIELEGSLTITQQEIFIKWAQSFDFENKTQLHQILWQSFDLQPLNKRFYQEVTRNFTELVQHLVGEKVFADHKHAALFTNRLIGRLIFCWFLRKKGIISDTYEYFVTNDQKSTDYYKHKLEKLFFGILNTPIEDRTKFSNDHINLFGVVKGAPNLFTTDTETPFLNGGLFEPRPTDHFGENKITFPNDYFDRFFTFLNQYNFTTDESTSSFQQVAIDPEMLGRIFENLLAEQTEDTGEQARKAKGAFYTPREIVDYMCRESMRAYIASKLPDDEKKEYILELLFDKKEHEFDNRNHRADLVLYKKNIIEALDEVKVLDPACGSGAFPMGILQLILGLYERLETRFDPYKTKMSIIQNNLYGIDIEPMAVEIARLRVWLSILVDEELNPKAKNMGVDPLPNLDFKFVCANSLIDLDQSGKVTLYGDDPDLENKLQTIRDAYFNTESVTKKKKLRNDYDKIVNAGEGLFGQSEKARQLKTYRPFDTESSASFFNPQFMFGVKTFQVLIANPPYIDSEGMVKNGQSELRDQIQKTYKWTKGNWDIYIAFFELGFKYTDDNGVLTYITPDKWIAKPFGNELRKGIIDNIFLILKSGRDIFESAKVDSIITFISKSKHATIDIVGYENEKFVTKKVIDKKTLASPFALDHLFSENLDFTEKISHFKKKLSDFAKAENACATSDAYKLKPFVESIEQKDFDKSKYFKIINTGTISKYISRWDKKEMTYLGNKYAFPVVQRKVFLENFTNSYGKKATEPKIIIKGLNLLDGCIDLDGSVIPAKTTLVITAENIKNLKFILGLINSSIVIFYIKEKYPASSYNQGTTFTKDMINDFPIPESIKEKDRNTIIDLVDEILKIKKSNSGLDTKDIEDKIDTLVYDLYGLTEDEIAIIKSNQK